MGRVSRRDEWAAIWERFDPEAPATRADWRAPRSYSPIPRIEQALSTPFGDRRILLTGTIGSGKTTELLRLAEARAGHDLVIYLDLVRHFGEVMGDMRALQHIGAWEVVFLAGMAVVRAAEEVWGHRWKGGELKELERVWVDAAQATGALSPDAGAPASLEIPNLLKSMIVLASGVPGAGTAAEVGLQTLKGAISAVRWSIPVGDERATLPDQRAEMRALLAAVNRVIEQVGRAYGRRVLILVDGLDRIREIDRARTLFVDSELVSRLACPVVVCAPGALRHSMVTAQVRGFEIHTLVNVPVLDSEDPTKPGPGIGFFEDVYRRRVADLEGDGPALLSAAQLRSFAYYSGGRARDFVRMVQLAAEKAWQADVASATDAMAAEARDDTRKIFEYGMHRGVIDVLQAVRDDPAHRLPDDPAVWELLAHARLMPYPGDTEWYYPHPLLTLGVLAAERAG